MMTHLNKLLLSAIVIIAFATSVQSLRLELYEEKNYEGFVDAFTLSEEEETKCINNPVSRLGSIKTDKCILVYWFWNCNQLLNLTSNIGYPSYYFYSRIDGNNPEVAHDYEEVSREGSFQACSQKLGGGPQLDLDVYSVEDISDWGNPKFGEQHREYRGVCGCTNFPSWVREVNTSSRIFIDNHGNSVNIYEGENCKGQSKHLIAGVCYENWHIGDLPYAVRSFKPTSLENCYSFDATIHKFHFSNGTDSLDALDVEKVQLAATSTLSNNGASEISETYTLNSRVVTTVQFSVANSLTKMKNLGFEVGGEYSVSSGVPGVASSSIKASIKTSFQHSTTDKTDTSNTTTASTEDSIQIAQQIRIPPCKLCTVSTYVKKVKGFVIKYQVYASVKAAQDAQPFTADEIRANLPAGMTYIRNLDRYTVEAVTEGTMTAEFGIDSVINVDCIRHPDCGLSTDNSNQKEDHQVYVIPIQQ